MEGVPVGAQKAERLLGGFIQQFDPEFSQPGFEKTRQVGNPGLGAGIEDGIAATDIGPDGVGFADAVADGDAVAVAGAATGEVVFSLGKKGGEDAVLHMKHRNVLMEGELKPFRRGGPEEFEDLTDIEVVARGEGPEAFGDEQIGGKRIGNIEREVANHGELERTEIVEAAEIANEDSVRFGVFDQAKKSGFTGLLDSGSGEKDRDLGLFADDLDGGGEAPQILKIEIEQIG